jgi:hypothetical protein
VILPDLKPRENLTMSQTEWHDEAGEVWRLVIKSDPREGSRRGRRNPYQQVRINDVTTEGLKIKTTYLAELQFDDEGGTAHRLFVPIGALSLWVEGHQTFGRVGDLVVE